MRAWLIAGLLLVLSIAGMAYTLRGSGTASADTCAFPFTPTTYEGLKNRETFLTAIDLAANNLLFPGDKDFGLPDLKVGPRNARKAEPGRVPPVLLKSISWIESSITQSSGDVPWASIGPALITYDCGHGIAQVTSGMSIGAGENGRGTPQQALVATNFAYNVARGAYVLADKWNGGGEKIPIAGSDSSGHPLILENWYFAVWAYNGFTGPGATRSNHPQDPIFGTWPRQQYSCGPSNDGKGHNRSNYPYQELVFGCANNPPVVEGKQLWSSQPISLPDLSNQSIRSSLSLNNFVFPYSKMDIPTSQPFHMDNTAAPDASLRTKVIGSPQMVIPEPNAKIGFDPTTGSSVEIVNIANNGSGVMTWYAVPSVSWLVVAPYTGVAVGQELPCADQAKCDRIGHLQVAIDSSKAPPGKQKATITVYALGTNQQQVINIETQQVARLSLPGVARGGR
jgi:hypothetical protein